MRDDFGPIKFYTVCGIWRANCSKIIDAMLIHCEVWRRSKRIIFKFNNYLLKNGFSQKWKRIWNEISKWKEVAIASNCEMAKNFPTPTGQVRECNFQCWTLHSSSYLKVYFENQNSATLFFLQLVSLLCANYQGNQLNSASPAFENVWPISSKLRVKKTPFKFSIDDLFTKIRIWFFLNSRQ